MLNNNKELLQNYIIIFFKDDSYFIPNNCKLEIPNSNNQMYPHYGYNSEYDLIFDYPNSKQSERIIPLINIEDNISYIFQVHNEGIYYGMKLHCLRNSKMSNSDPKVVIRINTTSFKTLDEDSLSLVRILLHNYDNS